MVRRRWTLWSLAALAVACVVLALTAYGKPAPSLVPLVARLTYAAPRTPDLTWPATAEAAVGAEGFGLLATHGAQRSRPTASVAKVMVALLVLRRHPLALGQQGPVLTMTRADVDSYDEYVERDGSTARVVLGEKLTEYQALEALLLPSADNMADTLARWAYGSLRAYSAAANAAAASLGMTGTHFGTIDASGLSPTTVSTPRDLVLLGEAALRDPVLARIVAERAANIPVAGRVYNYNWLLGSDGVDGIKTGNSDAAGGVLLFSARERLAGGRSVTVVGAVMDGSATLTQCLEDSLPLVRSAEASFAVTTLVRAGEVVGTYRVPWARNVVAVAGRSLTAVTWPGRDISLVVVLRALHAPVAGGSAAGTVRVAGDAHGVSVAVGRPVPSPSWYWRLLHVF